MGYADIPAETDAEKILAALDALSAILTRMDTRAEMHADAINSLGRNLQWVFDQAAPLLQMMSNPAMMGMMGPALSGAMNAMGGADGGRPEGE